MLTVSLISSFRESYPSGKYKGISPGACQISLMEIFTKKPFNHIRTNPSKHTQNIGRQFAEELFECVWSFCMVGAHYLDSLLYLFV